MKIHQYHAQISVSNTTLAIIKNGNLQFDEKHSSNLASKCFKSNDPSLSSFLVNGGNVPVLFDRAKRSKMHSRTTVETPFAIPLIRLT